MVDFEKKCKVCDGIRIFFIVFLKITGSLLNIQNGGLRLLIRIQFVFCLDCFTSDFDQFCGRLHGLIMACISKPLAFYFAVSFNTTCKMR